MSITHAIWRHAVESLEGKTVNLSGISQLTGTRIATLWTYHHGRARWTAELWLKSLVIMGAARIENGVLMIPVPADLDAPASSDRALRLPIVRRTGDSQVPADE